MRTSVPLTTLLAHCELDAFVGSTVGSTVGSSVGVRVGIIVGCKDGDGEGAGLDGRVGEGVGMLDR